MILSWVWSSAVSYKHFRGICCLHIQGRKISHIWKTAQQSLWKTFMMCSIQHLPQILTWTCNGDVPFSQLLGCPVLLLGWEEVTDTPALCNMGCTTDSLGSVWVANPTVCWTTPSVDAKLVPHCTDMDDLVVTVLVVVVVVATLLDGEGFCCKLAGVSGMIWLPTWCWYRTGIWVVWCGTCVNQINWLN
jgi:hypothetical protein